MNRFNDRLCVLLASALILLLTGCASDMDRNRSLHPDPNTRLDQMLELYQQSLVEASGCGEIFQADRGILNCERILLEVERLQVEFPQHARIQLSTAVLNYQAGRPDKAQFLLDQLLALRGRHPEAAILRSRIALEQGNSGLARELLQRQILRAPEYPELREALAAAFYLEGKYAEASRTLAIASRLGAPGWRQAYHNGLISEARRNWQQACGYYRSALHLKPAFTAARARMIGLGEHLECTGDPQEAQS